MKYRFCGLFDFPHLAEFFSPRVVPAPDWPVKRFCKTTEGAKKKQTRGECVLYSKKGPKKT